MTCFPAPRFVPLLTIALSAGCHLGAPLSRTPLRADSTMLAGDVRYLASDALEGRGTGTAGNDSAR